MRLPHYLSPLLTPASVALVGASNRAGTIGRIMYENLLEGGFKGDIHAVNPNHRQLLGRRCHKSLAAIGKPVELALIVVPPAAVATVLEEGARAGLKAAMLFTAPPTEGAKRWQREILAIARARRIRILGAHAFGVVRTDLGLNATVGAGIPLPGRLALVAQSGAVCTAMLDFATPVGIGFSTVVALGGGIDIDFGELLDALVTDPGTDAILLYIETVRDARRFLSALRAAARTKPVVVLKSGRAFERQIPGSPSPDAVFDAALKRAGTVRVNTYVQLFSAARILAMGRIPRGERLAIVTNGHGPAVLAADSAADRGVTLAALTPETEAALASAVRPYARRANPVDVGGEATPEQLTTALDVVLADPNVDAVLVVHVPRPTMGATDVARAVAAVARTSTKPVLGAWLGAIERHEVRDALEAGGVANYYSPEIAVEALSFLGAYRRNQALLLEVPPSQPEPQPLDLAVAERIREAARESRRKILTDLETRRLLGLFGLPIPQAEHAETLSEAIASAKRMGYPVALSLDPMTLAGRSPKLVRRALRNRKTLARAYGDLLAGVARRVHAEGRAGVIVAKERVLADARDVAIGVRPDAVFGPVITFGSSGVTAMVHREQAVLLPPLNRRLALEIVGGTRAAAVLRGRRGAPPDMEPLADLLVQVSALVCALPWVRELTLDPVHVVGESVVIGAARIVVDPRRRAATGAYRHMAIHPYPIDLVTDVTLKDGAVLHVRPMRPEDAALERAFVDGLSDRTRYLRFHYQLNALSPSMLARFTQVDYDREQALVALTESAGKPAFVAVARYFTNPDEESAEFAIVVADAWHGRGVARMLMARLIACAKKRGLKRLEGSVLRENRNMLQFTEALGFVTREHSEDPHAVTVVLELG